MKTQNKELKLARLEKEYKNIEKRLNDQLVGNFLLNSEIEYDLLIELIIVEVNLLNNGRIYLSITANCQKWTPDNIECLGKKVLSLSSMMTFQKHTYKECPQIGRTIVRENLTDIKMPDSGWLD